MNSVNYDNPHYPIRASLKRMRCAASFSLLALLPLAWGVADAQTGLSYERSAGLGLKSARTATDPLRGSEVVQTWQERRSTDFALYGGARDVSSGLRPAESYLGVVHPLAGDLAVSLEGGYVPETTLTPRRYALTGQVHTAFNDEQVLSAGLKYRVYDPDAAQRSGLARDVNFIGTGYTLAPYGFPGATPASSYQLQLSYQYSTASTLGLVLGRDLETYTPYFEYPGSGPRQFAFTGRYSLTPSWALSYDVLSQDSMSPLRPQAMRLGVRYRF
jgi:hypothetical protein